MKTFATAVSSIEPLEARIAPAFAASISLGSLDGSDGFKINGIADGDLLGRTVSAAGDVNGDQFGDFIINATGANEGGTDRGAAYIVFGKAGGFGASFSLAGLDGTNGFKLSGVADTDYAGVFVSAAGDVNGDGFDDVIVGAYHADEGGTDRGAAYVVFGKASGFGASLALASLNGTNGFKLSGVADGDLTGRCVSGAGDVNGDGFDDVVVGAYRANGGGDTRGVAYVVFGKASGFGASVALSGLNGSNGFTLTGVADFDLAGRSVSAAGDVNGDGFDDLIVGAHLADGDGYDRGAAYIVFGKASGFSASVPLSGLDGTNGFKLSGIANADYAGRSVSGAGDVNGDGFDDVIVGGSFADEGGLNRGAAYVVFGKASGFTANLSLAALDGTNGFKLSGVTERDYAGRAVSGAGDVNGDGFGDVIIGAYAADEGGLDRGAAYVVFGKASGFAPSILLATLDGNNGFKLTGVANNDHAAGSICTAGDVNGDGFADLIIGAPAAAGGGTSRGVAYVVFGGTGGGTGPGEATISPNGKTATFIDVDGDKVTVKTTKGKFTAGMFDLRAEGLGFQLEALNLTDPLMAGTNLTFKAKPVAGAGNKMVNVGAITAGFDLGKVKLPGDLGQIDCGDGDSTTAALKSLSVSSLGMLGAATQDPSAVDPLHSVIAGSVGTFTVKGDVKDAFLDIVGNVGPVKIGGSLVGGSAESSGAIRATGDLGPIKISHDVMGGSAPDAGSIKSLGKLLGLNIGGSLIGGSSTDTGDIFSNGDLGPVKITHDIMGSSGTDSGLIFTFGGIAGVSIGGSLIGGSNSASGTILSSGDIGPVKIGGDVQGGSGETSGVVKTSEGMLARATVGGSLIGGAFQDSGRLVSKTAMGAVKIGHDLTGGSITGSASLDSSGVIECFGGRIASVTIGGSIISGTDTSSGALTFNATIRAADDIGKLTIKGGIVGNATSPVIISASGQATPGATRDIAIGKLTITGGVEFARILAGYNLGLNAINGDASIGKVKVGGDWTASSLVAGIADSTADGFGQNDTLIPGGDANIIATIASITIKGTATGSAAGGDFFGITAEVIKKAKINGTKLALTSGKDDLDLDAANADFRLVEI